MGWTNPPRTAARQIRFKPAQQDGQPVDSPPTSTSYSNWRTEKGNGDAHVQESLVSNNSGWYRWPDRSRHRPRRRLSKPSRRQRETASPVVTVDQAIDRVIAREHDEVATIRRFSPVIETYIQDMKTDKEMGAIPVKDHYFLGQADLSKGIVDHSMLGGRKGKFDAFNPLSHMSGLFTSSYVPEGFLQMIYMDTSGFDRQHYQFDYVRREFLGEVRCVVFDITPLPKSGKGRFKGRIWAEDQNFTIVRFNGVYTPVAGINSFNLHFDSWRLNVQPGLWLPSYIYSQESDLKDSSGRRHPI